MNKNLTPIVGQGATEYVGSDRYAYEVTFVSDDAKMCKIKRYDFKFKEGATYFGNQEYVYDETTLNGPEYELRFVYGKWMKVLRYREFINFENTSKTDRAKCYDEEGVLQFIPGITANRRSYDKINISFGHKSAYQDPHF